MNNQVLIVFNVKIVNSIFSKNIFIFIIILFNKALSKYIDKDKIWQIKKMKFKIEYFKSPTNQINIKNDIDNNENLFLILFIYSIFLNLNLSSLNFIFSHSRRIITKKSSKYLFNFLLYLVFWSDIFLYKFSKVRLYLLFQKIISKILRLFFNCRFYEIVKKWRWNIYVW